MKSIIHCLVVVTILTSVSFAQTDTLTLNEIQNISLPDSITQFYIQDLNSDSLKELILCTMHNIYVYNSGGTQLLWTSPLLPNPRELQFDNLNGDSLYDIVARNDSNIVMYDWYHSSSILEIAINPLTYGCFTVGDVDDDGASDFVIANKQIHQSGTSRDTVWIDIYYGPSYATQNGFTVTMANTNYSPPNVNYSYWQWPRKMKIYKYGSVDSFRKMIAIFSATSESNVNNYQAWQFWASHGGFWLIDTETFQGIYREGVGFSEANGVFEQGGTFIPYSLYSKTGGYISGSPPSHCYARYILIMHNPLVLLDSTQVCYFERNHEGYSWIYPNWQGFAIGEVSSTHYGPELFYGLSDSLVEYSISEHQRVWRQTIDADSQIVKSIYHLNSLFPFPQLLIKNILLTPEYYFIDGTNHAFRAVLPYNNIEISQVSDLNNDQNDEVLSIAGNSLHIYSLLRVTSIGPEQFLPDKLALFANYPNPFNSQTTIRYNLPEKANVKLEIYDIAGRLIERLEPGLVNPGINQTTWDATGKSSGVYFCRITAGNEVKTGRMMLLK